MLAMQVMQRSRKNRRPPLEGDASAQSLESPIVGPIYFGLVAVAVNVSGLVTLHKQTGASRAFIGSLRARSRITCCGITYGGCFFLNV